MSLLVLLVLFQDFLTQLVCNLLEEGNALFKDREWDQAVKMFTEGLNVSDYAEAEEIHIPQVLLESLFVNRATAFHSMVRNLGSSERCWGDVRQPPHQNQPVGDSGSVVTTCHKLINMIHEAFHSAPVVLNLWFPFTCLLIVHIRFFHFNEAL